MNEIKITHVLKIHDIQIITVTVKNYKQIRIVNMLQWNLRLLINILNIALVSSNLWRRKKP